MKTISQTVKCPKCGSTNIEVDKRFDDYSGVMVWDECKDCKHEFNERYGR